MSNQKTIWQRTVCRLNGGGQITMYKSHIKTRSLSIVDDWFLLAKFPLQLATEVYNKLGSDNLRLAKV